MQKIRYYKKISNTLIEYLGQIFMQVGGDITMPYLTVEGYKYVRVLDWITLTEEEQQNTEFSYNPESSEYTLTASCPVEITLITELEELTHSNMTVMKGVENHITVTFKTKKQTNK